MNKIETELARLKTTSDLSATAAILGSQLQFSAGASPPVSPATGDLWLYEDTTNNAYWLFRYNSAQATYKWEAVGASSLFSGPLGSISTTSTSYVDLTSGPTLTVPRAGEYELELGAFAQITVFTSAVNLLMQSLASTSGAGTGWDINVVTALFAGGRASTLEKRTLVASETLKIQVKGSGAHTSTFNNATMRLRPLRVN